MIVDGLKHDELRLTRTAAESINLKLKPANTEYLGRLLEIGHIGRQSSKLLPLVFAWMQMCGQQIDDVDTHRSGVHYANLRAICLQQGKNLQDRVRKAESMARGLVHETLEEVEKDCVYCPP